MCSDDKILVLDDYIAPVVSCAKIMEDVFALSLKCPAVAGVVKPGQFVMIRFSDRTDPLLGRPFAVAMADALTITVLFRVVGKMTDLLSRLFTGQNLSLRGPIGNNFATPPASKVYLAAGTLGAAPLLFFYQKLCKEKDCEFLLGVPSGKWRSYVEWLRKYILDLKVFSDDGSLGEKGNPLLGLPEKLPAGEWIAACGPEPMLRALCRKHGDSSERILVSLEKRMACGMGGCMGCAIDTLKGKRRVCVDGPVFSGAEVCWDELG